MIRNFLLFIMAVCGTLNIAAQDAISVKLTPQGTFTTDDGSSFAIIPFEGKTATDLYNQVVENVNVLYNDPKEVLSCVPNEMVTIYAISNRLAYDNLMFGIIRQGYGFYTIKVNFKDGRIKVEMPIVDKVTFGIKDQATTLSYSYVIGKYFDKKGQPKKKRVDWITDIESYFGNILTRMVYGSPQSNQPSANDDW